MSCFSGPPKIYNKNRKFTGFQDDQNLKSKNLYQTEINSMIYPSNFIKTSRYTLITFLPFSLLLQFQRYANIYFLVTAILQCIPQISPLSAYVAVAPLIFVLSVSMAREGYEDYQRHSSDKEQNYSAKTKRVKQDRTEESVAWANIHVGDILHIQKDECFPADLLVLGSDIKGVCYIETGALDGEKNLKPRAALPQTASYFSTDVSEENAAQQNTDSLFSNKSTNFHIQVSANAPDQDPNHFTGSIGFYQKDPQQQQVGQVKELPAATNQFVPRGAFLRNTESIYAIVTYTGMDSKIMRNAEEGKAKSSDMESKMNTFILGILVFQLLCAFIMSSCSYYWLDKNDSIFPYLWLHKDGLSNISQSVLVYFSYFILFNTMIPISLVVSLEMVKVLQSYFISNDFEMYSAHNDRWPRVLTSTINEELGQIEYVFSDKTGTLTQNQMQFKMSIIGNTLYGEKASKKKKPVEAKPQSKSKQFQHTEFVFEDEILTDLLNKQASKQDDPQINLTIKSQDGKASYNIPTQYDLAREYFKNLGLAHECIVEKNKDPEDKAVYYQGPSPDEITLVDAAYHMGFTFVGKTSESVLMRLKQNDKESVQQFKVLNVFEFSSARKRMSLLLEDNGVYKMYVKGADNVIKDRLDENIPQPFLQNADKKLTEFSLVGLRTLLIAMKVMSKDEVDKFIIKQQSLANSQNRNQDLEKLADEVERGFFLLGATAVEDKLQDEVPETIHDLLRANIKVWMLTGDKLETAENIAKSCKLILEDFELLTMSNKDPKVIKKEMTDVLWRRFKKLKEIEGDCLKVIFQKGNEDIKKKFVQITKDCESVVCCRVSPVQKAEVVRSIREGLDKITLAIGDGANDVNMIQAAHIGCGIYGNEGMRAVQSSDFAFGQFKCLWRLIFVHGRWSYIRISEMIVYFFYKNIHLRLLENFCNQYHFTNNKNYEKPYFRCYQNYNYIKTKIHLFKRIFTIPQLFFAFYSGFSAQSIFDDYYISMYNLIFTALPLIIRAIFDQDVNHLYIQLDKKALETEDAKEKKRLQRIVNNRKTYIRDRLPNLYYLGQKQQLFSTRIFLEWVIQGFVHGLIIFYSSYWCVGDHVYEDDGFTSDQWSFSLIIFTSVVFIADSKLAIHTRYWTTINYIAFYITSIGLYIAAFFITGKLTSSNVYETPNYLVQTPHFYLLIFFIVAGIFAFDMLIFSAKELFVNKTKEKALRKLMKEQPKKSGGQNSKWVFEGSAIELESNLDSFIEKQAADESMVLLSSQNINRQESQKYNGSQTIKVNGNGQGKKGTDNNILSSPNDSQKKNNPLLQCNKEYNSNDHHLPLQTSPSPNQSCIQNINSYKKGDQINNFDSTFTDCGDDDDIYYKNINLKTLDQYIPKTQQIVEEQKEWEKNQAGKAASHQNNIKNQNDINLGYN